jgi:hypothetical protein
MSIRVLSAAIALLLQLMSPSGAGEPLADTSFCAPLPPPTGLTTTVSTEHDLRTQAYSAVTDTTILVTPGTYDMQSFLHIIHDGIAIRGSTGNRGDVVLDFGGMVGGHFGTLVDADDVTIADLSIRNASEHGVSIQGHDRPTLYNLHILDIGSQLVKVNPHIDGINGSEDGLLACSRLEYTSSAPDSYTNGISAHSAHRWVVRDNEWYRIRAIDNTAVPTILFWSGSSDTIVERNLLVDCIQGISFGNSSHSGIDHFGGLVRNNMIYANLRHDVVIEMVHAQGWTVAHNTALLLNPGLGQTWGMEARFSDSQGTFAYNLSNMDILHDRDGAQGTVVGNITSADSSWFQNSSTGDLHLLPTAIGAIDQASPHSDVADDFDGDPRPLGSAPDVGADEFRPAIPDPITDLRVTGAFTAGGTLTATLGWSAPPNAVTSTLRYTRTRITSSNWPSATLLTNTLPCTTEIYVASIPHPGGIAYFAMSSQNVEGEWSTLSNNAFWPSITLFLPLVMQSG